MPQIIVTAENPRADGERAVMFTERVSISDFESDHFQAQLVERLRWAVGDAHAVEEHGLEPAAGQQDRDPAANHLDLEPPAGQQDRDPAANHLDLKPAAEPRRVETPGEPEQIEPCAAPPVLVRSS
jgi:hypothetical protein